MQGGINLFKVETTVDDGNSIKFSNDICLYDSGVRYIYRKIKLNYLRQKLIKKKEKTI